MDPSVPACGWQNLLNSQQPNPSFSFASDQIPGLSFSASDASVFGSQWTEEGNEDVETSKRRKLDDQTAQSSNSVAGEAEAQARPEGVKAAKGRGKKAVTKPATLEEEGREFQSIWEIKQKDFALKEKLNKQKILDSLIAKTEPLTDLEIALKNKLITDMLET
ncbi:hypothetical protein Bca4012_065677 [Brassica carinata]